MLIKNRTIQEMCANIIENIQFIQFADTPNLRRNRFRTIAIKRCSRESKGSEMAKPGAENTVS